MYKTPVYTPSLLTGIFVDPYKNHKR